VRTDRTAGDAAPRLRGEEISLIVLADVLSRQEVLVLREGLAIAPFREGRGTAGAVAERVKSNEQARGDDPGVIALGRRVRLALEAHSVFRTLGRPVRWSNMIFSRYGPGQQYGLHADSTVMYDHDGWPLRTDLSFTLFLSDAETYEGGALVVRDLSGDREFRPKAGSAVLYSTGQLHTVTPVTSGVRLACVGWVQSWVRRPDQREILFDLECMREGVGSDAAALLLDKTIGNLLRMWGED
jgi:PKHD-type hydroxylase